MDNRHPRPRSYGRHAAPQHPPSVQPHSRAPSIRPQHHLHHQQQQILPTWSELRERAKLAVAKAWKDMLAAGQSVSVWKISQAALLTLEAGPETALAQQMQQLPSLQALMAVETKINAFIHCFVAARGMTSLYDLESAICKNEGLERFEELEIGPFLQHPLVKDYFSLNGDVSEVLKISSEEIISYLGDYLYKMKGKWVVIEEFLDFLAKKKSVATKEKLGVRIRSLGLQKAFLWEARRSEHDSLRKSKEWKLQLGKDGERIEVPQTDYLPTAGEDILGGNFFGSSSDDEVGDKDSSNEVRRDGKDENFTNSKGKVKISQPDENPLTLEVKESAESLSCADWLRRDIKYRDAVLSNNANYTKKGKKRKGAKLVMEASALRIFTKTWKEACRKHSPLEVLELMSANNKCPKRTTKIVNMLSTHPGLGLLNVALASIKCGMLDDLYDTIGKESLAEITRPKEQECETSCHNKQGVSVISDSTKECAQSVTVKEIIDKVSEHLATRDELMSNGKSLIEKRIVFLKKLHNCGSWVAENFQVPEFQTLGYGEFFDFLEVHTSLLPTELQSFLMGRIPLKSNFEVSMLPDQLEVLFSQALSCSWDGEKVTDQMLSALLANQFPFLGLRVGDGSVDNLLSSVHESRSNANSKCLLFSQTLVRTSFGKSVPSGEDSLLETDPTGIDIWKKSQISAPNLSKDAIEIVLSAPMLSDLNSWTHWDQRFGPFLGPLVGWLLNEVNTNDLLCLVTRDGEVIRVDNSATLGSFVQCALKSSPFQMAVQLLSLFASLGGEKHVPLSLLKCHAVRFFDVVLKNHTESEAFKDTASKYFLECLGYLPTEFRAFATEVLLSALKSVTKDAPSVILSNCTLIDKRVMLHEVGFSLGIVEWIDDYHLFCSTANNNLLNFRGASHFDDELETISKDVQNEVEASIRREEEKDAVAFAGKVLSAQCGEISPMTLDRDEVSTPKEMDNEEESRYKEASLFIESIRREEFGLNSGLSSMESSLLKKQHARLGRALHCLAEELYSQDSHFLLELIQNADDNNYPEDMEPTLTFILQETGLTILNNERGFSAQNIRALCDVGNSTKKGTSAGYIGKKGVGFKSVFRVTNAPEIHSNGFHLKFDISEGQIGFVLPTLVAPHDIETLCKLASLDFSHSACDRWKTCIVVPFKYKLLEGNSRNSVMTMFADLHPSLLLFLHRLQCIKFRNMLDDSLTIMRREVLSSGITKVSHGEEEMNWFVVTEKLQANVIRRDAEATEIALAFPLQEVADGKYRPFIDQQSVFAFLPLRTYGLKFILQGDFILPSSREEVDGDDPWNQWLLSEFPKLFAKAQRSFCSLPCFEGSLGKAVTAYMSYVPLTGEVHGFFSSLPRMIVSKLRVSNCLLIEGDDNTWVSPLKVLRGWNQEAWNLLPDKLLREHLGLGFLDKDIIISDALARTLGIEEYGPKILLQVLAGLCDKKGSLQAMGLAWLSAWLNAFYTMSFYPTGLHVDYVEALRRLPFIPLSNGTFGSVHEGTIWLQSDAVKLGLDGDITIDDFPHLCSTLRTVNQAFLNELHKDVSTKMLLRLGVQQLSSHEITKLHVLPAISDDRPASWDKAIMVESLCLFAVHLQSQCSNCLVERENLVSEFRNKAFILTNRGCKRLSEIPIHFGKSFGSSINARKLFEQIGMEWHEVDPIYSKHPAAKSFLAREKWKKFFHDLGITEFVQVVQVEKGIADMPDVLLRKNVRGKELFISESVAKDWESPELEQLLSLLSIEGNPANCKFVLEVLDKLWADCFTDKTKGYAINSSGDSVSFSSSFVNSISHVQWVVSSMDGELHYPKDLFYDCDDVCSVLGPSAPYAVPKVKSASLLDAIGFKTKVTLEDIVEIIKVWTKSEAPFKCSIGQMSRLYTFLWKEMDHPKQNMMSELLSGPLIFLPFALGSTDEALVEGSFKSVKEVCWNDSTGALDQMKEMNPEGVKEGQFCKTLCDVYPGLRNFFVDQCGVHEIPSFCDYFQILQHLSAADVDPSEGAKFVFTILTKLADAVKSGEVTSEDILSIKDDLTKLEFRVFPTINKNWVSLHPSFGLVCWPDDEKLVKEFKPLDKIELLHFGELSGDEKVGFCLKMPVLLKTLGIPAFSEVLTREAIYYGLLDSSREVSLVGWSLPFAQRYIYHTYPEVYDQLRISGFSTVSQLLVVVVETLFYRYVVKSLGIASEKRSEISTLLQGNTLFLTRECNSHALFMELSRLFFDGNPKLHLANFLHMLMTMVESGSTEQQVEFFVVNSQKMPQLPPEEPVWSLSPAASLEGDDGSLFTSYSSLKMKPRTPCKAQRKAAGDANSNWPPSNWTSKSGSGFTNLSSVAKMDEFVIDKANGVEIIASSPTSEEDSKGSTSLDLSFSTTAADTSGNLIDLTTTSVIRDVSLSCFEERCELNTAMPEGEQAVQTGRLGELAAFKYFCEKHGQNSVKWVNEDSETGCPYDITVAAEGRIDFEYIEVKATRSVDKDWFSISAREWEFAAQKGKAFSIAHVVLVENSARIRMFRDPVELCRLGKLQLAVLMPKKQQQASGNVM